MLDPEELRSFVARDWRRQCRVFRQAVDPAAIPLTPTEICALTADERVESRLISPDFSVTHGPFEMDNSDEALLPASHMLMVQCLEQLTEPVSDMLTGSFGFIPRWQVDDVMASIGETGASCGAHFDHYDVFLVQHTGCKTWHLDDGDHTDEDLRDDVDVRLLREFSPAESLRLEPGDVLYIPPGFGHHGICEGTSVTLSVGIRNPTHNELLDEVSTHALHRFGNSVPLDPHLHVGGTALPHDLIEQFTRAVHALLDDKVLMRWYGSYVTRLREPALLPEGRERGDQQEFSVSLPSRLAWTQDDNVVLLFVNGETFELPPMARDWVPGFCRDRQISLAALEGDPASERCITELVNTGVLL